MPEIGIRHKEFSARIIQQYRSRRYADDYRVEALHEIASDYGITILGEGVERFVYIDPEHTNKVILVPFANDSVTDKPKVKISDFYLHNIFATIFPHNFPRVHGAFVSGEPHLSGWIADRIEKTDRGIIYPFSDVATLISRRSIGVDFDGVGSNFITGPDGGRYYVDRIEQYRPLNDSIFRLASDARCTLAQSEQVRKYYRRVKWRW